MNTRRWSVVCAWMVLPAFMAQAQAQAQAPDAEAQERAQRDADNPLRLIIEAGKIRAKPKPEADARAEAKTDGKAPVDKPAAHAAVARQANVEPVAPRAVSTEATRAAALASVRTLTPAPEVLAERSAPPQTSPVASGESVVVAPAVTQPAEPALVQPAAAVVAPPPAAATLPPDSAPVPAPAAQVATPREPPEVPHTGAAEAPEARPGAAASSSATPTSATPSPVSLPASAPAAPAAAAGVEVAREPTTPATETSAAPNPAARAASGAGAGTLAAETTAQEPAAAPRDAERVALALASPALAPAIAPPPPASLELLSSVQPELPDRILRRMRRDGEVLLVFKVNPDGTVADLNVQSSSDSALDAIALDAVRQWRYKPIAEARTHRLQLVFKHQ